MKHSYKTYRNSLLSAACLMLMATMAPAQEEYADGVQYQVQDLEILRSELSEFLDTVHEYSDLVLPYDLQLAATLDAAQGELEQYSLEQLNLLRAVLNPDNIHLDEARAALTESRPLFEAIFQSPGLMPAGLPGWQAPTAVCDALIGSGYPSEALIIGANLTFDAAVDIRTEASSVCNQLAIAELGGEGGSTSAACAVTDGLFLAAQAVRDKITSCSALYTARRADVNSLGIIAAGSSSTASGDALKSSAPIDGPVTQDATVGCNVGSGTWSTECGINSAATDDDALAVGNAATASGFNATALGTDTTASGTQSVAVGDDANASGAQSTAVGEYAVADFTDSTAVGQSADVGAIGATAVGADANAVTSGSVSIGAQSDATGSGSVAVGGDSNDGDTLGAQAGSFATAIGGDALANGTNAVAVGEGSTASGASSTVVGTSSTASGTGSSAFGEDTTASGLYSTAIGEGAVADFTDSTAVGQSADVGGIGATAVGADANAVSPGNVSIGAQSDATGSGSVAVGGNSNDGDTLGAQAASFATAIGSDAQASGSNAIAVGEGSTASGDLSTVVGTESTASGSQSSAFGVVASATAANSIAIGAYSSATQAGAIAIGGDRNDGGIDGALALGIDSIAIGPDAVAVFNGAIVIGNGVSASETDQVILRSADVFTILGNGDTGLGTAAPTAPLHLLRSDDSAKILVEETNAVQGPRTLFEIKNNGNPEFRMSNSGNGNSWLFSAGLRFVVKNNAGDWVSRINAAGDMEITGELTTTGGICGLGGCDLVFHPDTKIESIQEHASQMWAKSYLPSVGPTEENASINLSQKTGGMLNELEKAHIYIEQLHIRNLSLEQRAEEMELRVRELEQQNQRIEALVMLMVMEQAESVAMD